MTVFLNTCHALWKGCLLSTNLIVVTRFKFCTSPGSLDSLDLMMKVFDDEFSEEFMCLAVPLDRRPANVVQCAKTDVSDWPQLVPETTKLRCAQSYRQATIWQPPAICAVCSRRCSASDGKHGALTASRTLFTACRQCFILAALTSPVATLTLQTAVGHMTDSGIVV